MDRFLQQILNGLGSADLPGLRSNCYVFPTRRAGLFFEQALARKFPQETFWAPQIFSIQDFVESSCGSKTTDDLTLLFELYSVYQKYQKDLLFDEFFSWGQILLADFDEIDRYLVDANLVYRNLQDIKDIEVAFADKEQLLEAYRQFAKIVADSPESRLVSEFVKTWELARKVYHDFQLQLSDKGMAYGGMLYREMVSRLEDPAFKLPYQKVIFAGFNALTRSEQVIFDTLLEQGSGKVFWDADTSYLADRQQEAGYFLRQYQKKWSGGDMVWVTHESEKYDKDIQVIGVPQGVGQAKITGLLLKETVDPQKTAVVLADENLLFPVLYSLPKDVEKVNVSMGYPLRNSPLYSLVRDYVQIQVSKKGKGEGVYFRAKDLLGLMANPYLQAIGQDVCITVSEWIKSKHLNWVKVGELTKHLGHELIGQLLQPALTVHVAFGNVIDFLVKLNLILFSESKGREVDQEVLYQFVKLLKQLDQRLSQFEIGSGFEFLERIIKETIQPARVPFTGEPLAGLQILGFLETRVLDFENIIILSTNENKIPASNVGKSYLPYSLRKAFELPTFREQDSIYSYHFFRLLQRAKRAFIIYDTEVEIDGSGEKSRFLLQLIDRYRDHPRIKLSERVYTSEIPELNQQPPEVIISKNQPILDSLSRFLVDSEQGSVLGPTVLGNYIDCSLRFYFRYIAGLKETEEYSSEMDPREFGLVVHEILESMYADYVSKTIDSGVIDKVGAIENIQKILKQKLQERFLMQEGQSLEGRNLLNHRIIQSLIEQILTIDQKHAPFELVAVESKDYSLELDIGEGKSVRLGGTVDRIDRKGDDQAAITRIIDYKTGKINLPAPTKSANPDIQAYMDEYFSEGKYKAGFQGYYYGYLLAKLDPAKNIKIGIFGLQEINKGIQFLRGDQVIGQQIFKEFENRLTKLLQEIWDPEVPFSQTEDTSKCTICAYATICSRQ